jgi:hypothetical protein
MNSSVTTRVAWVLEISSRVNRATLHRRQLTLETVKVRRRKTLTARSSRAIRRRRSHEIVPRSISETKDADAILEDEGQEDLGYGTLATPT